MVDQHVDRGDTSIRWRVTLGPQSRIERVDASGDPSVDAGPDAVFRQSIDTARAIAQGDTDAHQAFLLGDIRFEGSIDALITHRASFEWLEQTLAPVMEATTWD